MIAITKEFEKFAEAHVDDEIVVMRLDNGEFFSMAGTAATTWRLIDGTRDRAALIESLADSFDGDDVEIAKDVDGFLAKLDQLGLVRGV